MHAGGLLYTTHKLFSKARENSSMFCINCGAQNDDDAVFCTECGAPTNMQAEQLEPIQQIANAGPALVNSKAPEANSNNKQLKLLAIILGAAAIVLCIVTIIVFFISQNQKQIAPRPITISITADGYSASCTKIPVNASGIDSNGNTVETTLFIDEFGEGAELSPGEYDLSFPASPLTPDGILYAVPVAIDHVIIEKDAEPETTTYAFEDMSATFTKLTALNETDEMINQAYEYAIKDESQVGLAEELKQVAIDTHGQAVNADKERKEREAARLIDMPLYTVQIPEYWVGKVDIIKDGNDLSIKAKGYSDGDLISVDTRSRNSDVVNQGDIGGSLMQFANTSSGYRAELWMTRWTWLAGYPYNNNNNTNMEETCVQLETGGAVTVADIKRTWDYETGTSPYASKADEYINKNVVLKAKNGSKTVKTTEDSW